MLMGKEEADAGTIKIGETVSMVGVGQERMEQLDDSKTVFEGNFFNAIMVWLLRLQGTHHNMPSL